MDSGGNCIFTVLDKPVMIRHIVLFKIKEFSSEVERKESIESVLCTFRSLIGQIPQLRHFRVEAGIKTGPASCDVLIDSTFDSYDDLIAYQTHPAHLDAVNHNKQWCDFKISGDYEILA